MNSPMEKLLSRLDRVKKGSKSGSYIACCPAHDDRSPSLILSYGNNGGIVIHCFAGCSVQEIMAAVDMKMSDLFPRRDTHHCKSERRPFPATDILRVIAFEALIVATSGTSVLSGEPFTEKDRERLILAVSRIQSGLAAGGLNNG